MPNAVFKTNPSVAKPAATTEKQRLAARESISQQYAQIAVMKLKSRLSPKPTDLFTAVTASQKQEKSKSCQDGLMTVHHTTGGVHNVADYKGHDYC